MKSDQQNVRIALANIRVPATPDESVSIATSAITDAGRRGADVLTVFGERRGRRGLAERRRRAAEN